MPRYTYIAKSEPNQTTQGEIEAESEQEVISKLTKIGYFPISVQPENLSLEKQGIRRFWKITKKEIALFTSQLASLIESGVNIVSSLNIISGQTANKYLKSVIGDVFSKIKDGKSLSESLSAHPYIFNSLYTSMVRSGEAGGNLDLALKRLAMFLEKEEEFKNSIRAAMVYPIFIFLVGTGTVILLLTFVIPRLVTMFEDMGQMLPLPTQILINISGFLRNYWWAIIAFLVAAIFFLRRLYYSAAGRILWDKSQLRTAVLGHLVLKTEISRLTRTLSLLLSSGMPVVSALEISSTVVENQILRLELGKFKEQISGGLSFSQCLKQSKLFPDFVTNIVTVGEETGTLEKSLLRISEDYEKDVDRFLKTFTQMLEPVIILVMGLIVGFIVLSMLLPIFQINLIAR